jgi:hypothetical protein
LIDAFAGRVVPARTATEVTAIAKRINEYFLINEISIILTPESEG